MAPKPITQNTLFYGDNLSILRDYIPTESIDLIYLDPPVRQLTSVLQLRSPRLDVSRLTKAP